MSTVEPRAMRRWLPIAIALAADMVFEDHTALVKSPQAERIRRLNEAGAESGAGERGNEDGYDD